MLDVSTASASRNTSTTEGCERLECVRTHTQRSTESGDGAPDIEENDCRCGAVLVRLQMDCGEFVCLA